MVTGCVLCEVCAEAEETAERVALTPCLQSVFSAR